MLVCLETFLASQWVYDLQKVLMVNQVVHMNSVEDETVIFNSQTTDASILKTLLLSLPGFTILVSLDPSLTTCPMDGVYTSG
jgi:hypothetical protein